MLFWLLGTVSGAEWGKLGLPALVVVSCTLLLTAKARQLNALLLGDETAASLGVSVSRLRTQLLVISAALAAVISVAGGLGHGGPPLWGDPHPRVRGCHRDQATSMIGLIRPPS